ncbi:unnamed protein product [Lactuca saligna]|uniref:S-acyltransferase n=1 Tax=Lactuca saligna TaxID=75948 RepID=A0AA35YVV4_LACSI|nr:unnamed protein product [Lactuca saligna]
MEGIVFQYHISCTFSETVPPTLQPQDQDNFAPSSKPFQLIWESGFGVLVTFGACKWKLSGVKESVGIHGALYLISSFFASSSIIIPFLFSVMALIGMAALGRRCKRLFRLRGSAPAFVITNLFFIWCSYVIVIRQAVSSLLDIVFNVELIMLQIGLYRILSGDPGFVKLLNVDDESPLLLQRVRHCKHCDAYVKGFDHHCPAFGNCIGQNNHLLFMILLTGFITAEACYIMGASQILSESKQKGGWNETLVSSTMIFSILQVLWQGVFLAWHIYCVCFNIRTDEFIHWKRYPEFQHIVELQPGETITTTKFINPYDKGILQNLKEFIDARG